MLPVVSIIQRRSCWTRPGIFSEAEKAAIAEGKEAKVWVEITKTDLAEEEKAAFEQEAKKTAGENARLV